MLEHKPHAESGNGLAVLGGLEPVPVEGCVLCAAFSNARLAAGGVTRANLNDQISNHPHRRASDWRRP